MFALLQPRGNRSNCGLRCQALEQNSATEDFGMGLHEGNFDGCPAARESSAIGVLLRIHLAIIMAPFATQSYGKFVHAVYRFAALVRFHLERKRAVPESVQPAKRAEFVAAIQGVRKMRRRNGAYFWELFHDSADPACYIEYFMGDSWVEHLRQHERVSVSDRAMQQRARQFLVAGESTTSQHWLADREA